MYNSRKKRPPKITKEEQLDLIEELLEFFLASEFKIRIAGKWFCTTEVSDIYKFSPEILSSEETTIFVYNEGWGRDYVGSFKIKPRRRTMTYPMSMFWCWSSYSLHNIALRWNHKEIMGVNLK